MSKEHVKKILAGTKYWVFPEVVSDYVVNKKCNVGFKNKVANSAWVLSKNIVLYPGIVFGAILGSIYGVNSKKASEIESQFKKRIYSATEVLKSKIDYDILDAKEVVPGTLVVDPETGEAHGLLTYTKTDNNDKAKYLGRYNTYVGKEAAEKYIYILSDYENYVQKYENYVSTHSRPNQTVDYWTSASDQAKVLKKYAQILSEMADAYENITDNMENVKLTAISKIDDFNQSLYKNAFKNSSVSSYASVSTFPSDYLTNGTALLDVSPVTVNNLGTIANFTIDYLELKDKKVKFREAKVTINMSDYTDTEYDIEEYAYSKFAKNKLNSFTQNTVKPSATVNDDVLGL